MIQLPLGDNFKEKNPPLWIKQHILKLSTEFGVDFRGCEEKAEELLTIISKGTRGAREKSQQTKRKEQTN